MKIIDMPTPLCIAHRGVSARYPENTLSAFRAAKDAGAHMIELDVTLSKDRQLVVIHDRTVDRTTNASGAVKAFTLEQLSQLDAGSWFDTAFSREFVPSLEQVFTLVKGHLGVNIEIKPEAFEPDGPKDSAERQVLDLVREKNMLADVLVSSFEWQMLENLSLVEPSMALGLLSDVPADANLLHWYHRVKGFSWHPDYRVLTRPQVARLQDMGARVLPYAVDGEIDIDGMLAMGVDGLILDDPGHMV